MLALGANQQQNLLSSGSSRGSDTMQNISKQWKKKSRTNRQTKPSDRSRTKAMNVMFLKIRVETGVEIFLSLYLRRFPSLCDSNRVR